MTSLHIILSFVGMFLAVFVAQRSWDNPKDQYEPNWLRFMRRAALIAVAMSMMAGLLYADATKWEAWPPHLAVIGSVDLMLVAKTLSFLLARRPIQHSADLNAADARALSTGMFLTALFALALISISFDATSARTTALEVAKSSFRSCPVDTTLVSDAGRFHCE